MMEKCRLNLFDQFRQKRIREDVLFMVNRSKKTFLRIV